MRERWAQCQRLSILCGLATTTERHVAQDLKQQEPRGHDCQIERECVEAHISRSRAGQTRADEQNQRQIPDKCDKQSGAAAPRAASDPGMNPTINAPTAAQSPHRCSRGTIDQRRQWR